MVYEEVPAMARRPKNRSEWGSVFPNYSETRKDAKGRPLLIGYRAQYQAPAINPKTGRKIVATKKFKRDQKAMALSWLEGEREYCARCEKGLEEYRKPEEREKEKRLRAITLKQWADMWVDNYRKADGTPLRGNSMRALRNSVRNFLEALDGGRLLQSITTQGIEAMCESIRVSKGQYAARSTYIKLKACLKEATEVKPWHPRLLQSSPCTIPAPARPKYSEQSRIPEPTPEELRAIYDYMPAYLRIGVYLCATCGGDRVNELCALHVSDVDLKHRLIHIHRGLSRGDDDRGPVRIVEQTKNEASEAYVPIPAALVPLLADHIEKYTDHDDPEATLLRPVKGAAVSTNTFRKNFKEAAAKAGRPDLHVHTLRATFDTYAARLNTDGTMRDYMAVTRRTDEATAINAYQKSDAKRQAELADRIGAAIITSREEKPEADDSAALRARIAELERQLAEARGTTR